MKIVSIGIDIGKTTFHLVALDEHGRIVIRRKFSRKTLLAYSAKLTTSLIGMEACGGAHCLARLLREQGHEVRLIPGQFVKRYREANKNDYLDAEAIAEAVTRKNLRFVPIKTEDQLDVQGLHRVGEGDDIVLVGTRHASSKHRFPLGGSRWATRRGRRGGHVEIR